MLRFVLVLAVMAVALSSLVVLASIWRRGQLRRWPYLAAMTVASFLYAFGYGLELAGDTVAWKLATFRIQHLGIAFAPPLLAMVAGRFEFGRLLHEHWERKKRMSNKISNEKWNEIYDEARSNYDVLGGKIIGAGGGGFLMLYCAKNPRRLENFMKELGMPRVHYGVDREGTKVVASLPTG